MAYVAPISPQAPPQPPVSHWFDKKTGQPTTEFLLYMASLDSIVRLAVTSLVAANGVAAVALTTAGGQVLAGGFTETELDLGTPANGATITPNPSARLKQKAANNVAGFTIAATAEVGDLELRITNGASAGAITFSGFSKKFAGDALTTVNGDQFAVFIYGWGSKSAYLIKALQ